LGVKLHVVKDGILYMYGYETPKDKLANVDSFPWIRSMISTNKSYAQTYGYFEFTSIIHPAPVYCLLPSVFFFIRITIPPPRLR
jgi:hypothetical protein